MCCSNGDSEFGEGRGQLVSGIDTEAEFVVPQRMFSRMHALK